MYRPWPGSDDTSTSLDGALRSGHRGLHFANLGIDRRGEVVLLDLKTAATGHPLLDFGNLLDLGQLDDPSLRVVFVEGYDQETDPGPAVARRGEAQRRPPGLRGSPRLRPPPVDARLRPAWVPPPRRTRTRHGDGPPVTVLTGVLALPAAEPGP